MVVYRQHQRKVVAHRLRYCHWDDGAIRHPDFWHHGMHRLVFRPQHFRCGAQNPTCDLSIFDIRLVRHDGPCHLRIRSC